MLEFRSRRRGFTLIELLVVIAIMAGVIAMAAPRLLTVLLYSTHEGAARRLANYGTAAIAEASLKRETLTFKFDFATQEYWVETLPKPPDPNKDTADAQNTSFGDPSKDKNGLPKDDAQLERLAQAELAKAVPGGKRDQAGLKVLDEQARRMAEASFKRERSVLGARAARVNQDNSILPRSQQKKRTDLSSTAEQIEPVEVRTALLGRTKLPQEVKIVLVSVGGKELKTGIAEIEITPTGLDVETKFWLTNTEGRSIVVTWDPATGQTGFGQDTSK